MKNKKLPSDKAEGLADTSPGQRPGAHERGKAQQQVKLPISAAFYVVWQGIKVRFERSLITVMGVALGIAFLMSILAGQIIKAGVADEQTVRQDADRMLNVFTFEAGLPASTIVCVVESGELNATEKRFLQRLKASNPRALQSGLAEVTPETNALIFMGDGKVKMEGLGAAVDTAQRALTFTTREEIRLPGDLPKPVELVRKLSEEEVAKIASDAQKAAFRNIWIVTISLFVTLIGITNSMLMSVTERFREIGTMKCLGALSSFVRQMFLIESSLVGCAGSIIGALVGVIFSIVLYSFTYGFGRVVLSMDVLRLLLYMLICIGAGVVMAVLAALYPTRFASRMLPAHALRSEI